MTHDIRRYMNAVQTLTEAAREAYLYHGTAQARLPGIRHDGLLPAEKSRWSKDPFIGNHSIGKIHFVDSFDRAVFYAREASKTRPAILRMPRQAVADLQPDPRERDGAFYSERPVAPEHIERWNGKKWVPLIAIMHEAAPAGDEPYINAHRSGDIIWIDMMGVPDRGKGIGRRYYEQWEANLPPDIKLIRLMAADAGHGPSNGFWEAMGFDYQYAGDDLDYETSHYMWKGVNGHPTPPTVNADEDADE